MRTAPVTVTTTAAAITVAHAEALLKAISSLEGGYADAKAWSDEKVHEKLAIPTPDRLPAVFEALRRGLDPTAIWRITQINRWFLHQMASQARRPRNNCNASDS
jgi:carbamoyl-phosphate synthase large subunit